MFRALALVLAFAAPAAAQPVSGKKVFEQTCKACHDTGKKDNDAPQLSHTADWKERAKAGRGQLYRNSIEGVKGYFEMPPRGGDPKLSDDEVKAAVDYILERAAASD